MKQYVVRVVAGEGVETFLNEQAKQGYVLVNLQPVARRIRDIDLGTEEMVFSFLATMEKEVIAPVEEKKEAKQ